MGHAEVLSVATNAELGELLLLFDGLEARDE